MRYIKFVFWLLLLVVMNSCSPTKEIVINQNVLPIEIDYLPNDNSILIENIKINNTEIDGTGCFDTGAFLTAIDNSVAKQLKLKVKRRILVTDISGNTKLTPVVKIDSINISGMVFKNIYAVVVDLSIFNCNKEKIVLGDNVLNTGIWKIYLAKHKIVFYNHNEQIDYSGFTKIPFSHKSNSILLKLSKEESMFKNVLFDTGSSMPLTLSRKDKKEIRNMMPDCSFEYYYNSINSVEPKKIIEDYYFSSINMNGLVMDSVFTNYSKYRTIGLRLFEKSTIILDYKNNTIGIEQPFEVKKPVLKNTGVKFKSQANNEVIISALRKNSPADKLGVKVGEKVQTINNKTISEFSLSQCELVDSLNRLADNEMYLKLSNWEDSILLIPK